MSLLDDGRTTLTQSLSASQQATELANQLAAQKANVDIANKQAVAATEGQALGLGTALSMAVLL
jgi:hypothetical protein